MSLLTIVTNVCNRVGISAPLTASGSSDQQIIQIIAISNEEGEELSERYPWSVLQTEATFLTLAAELQGSVASIATNNFRYIINNTIWNRTQQRPMYGSLTASDWQLLKSAYVTGPYQEYRIRAGSLYLIPAPPAGETCAFEYVSGNWCQSSTGTPKSSFTNDGDTGILDEKIMTAGIIWRWKQIKGMDYAEDFRKYEIRVNDAMARDAGKPTISMDGTPTNRFPGIFVPQGNWPL